MRRQKLHIVVPLLTLLVAGPVEAQITSNPIPAPIEKRGLAVEIVEVARLPDTRGVRPAEEDTKPAGWARINSVKDLPDGRRFANDQRGFLYRIDSSNQAHVYLNLAEIFPPLLRISESPAVSRELLVQLRLLQATIQVKLDQFGRGRGRFSSANPPSRAR